MKKLNLKKMYLIFFATLLVNIIHAQCPNPVVCSSGTNGDIVSLKLGGVGGVQTVATFGYDAGIALNAIGSTPNLIFKTSGTTRMTILGSNGNIGIGTTSPQAKLDITGALNVSGIINFGSTAVSSSSNLSVTSGSNGSIVNVNVNGRGGLRTDASFGYDAGTIFYQPTTLNSTITVSGKAVFNGNVGIGCSNPTVKLAVNGKIQATEVEIKSAPCSDYVFEKNYNLRKLSEVEEYINTHKHLPEVPSAAEFAKNGYSVGQMDDVLLRKVEELTLYLIEQNKKIEILQQENKALLKSLNNK